jgi:hypothetical protein
MAVGVVGGASTAFAGKTATAGVANRFEDVEPVTATTAPISIDSNMHIEEAEEESGGSSAIVFGIAGSGGETEENEAEQLVNVTQNQEQTIRGSIDTLV